jgi:nitrate/nitrite-specific signal transduction histidine kinase
MERRAAAIGGELGIMSQAGHGTRVELLLHPAPVMTVKPLADCHNTVPSMA